MATAELQLEHIAFNFSGATRREKFEGRDYIVAPMALIVPGVLNGSQGPMYYPEKELSKNPSIWNGMPIVLDHPIHNGNPVSARTVEVLNKQRLGIVLQAKYNNRLEAEGWFDIEKTRQLAPQILNALESGQKIELSTGLGGDEDKQSGDFNGTSYNSVYRNYRPDHLAVFVDKVGACSIDDGCGVNNEEKKSIWRKLGELLGVINLGMLVGKTGIAVGSDRINGHTHKVQVNTDGFGVAEEADGHIHKIENFKVAVAVGHNHSLKEILLKSSKETQNSTKPKSDSKPNKDSMMNKEELITELVANCDCWTKEDQETLNDFSEERLKALNKDAKERKESSKSLAETSKKLKEQEVVINAAKEGIKVGNSQHTINEKGEWVENKEEKKPTKNEKKPEMKFEDLPEGVRNRLGYLEKLENEKKDFILSRLTVNVKDDDKEEMVKNLRTKTIDELEYLVKLLPEVEESSTPTYNYSGMAPVSHADNENLQPAGGPLEQQDWNNWESKDDD